MQALVTSALDLRLTWARNLAMLAVAERDALPQVEQLRAKRGEIAAAMRDTPPSPMTALAARLGLSAVQVDLLWIAVAVAGDPLLAVHVEALAGSAARKGASVSLFARLVGLEAAPAAALARWLAGPNALVDNGILVAGDEAPAIRTYAAPARLIAHLAGDDTCERGVRIVLSSTLGS